MSRLLAGHYWLGRFLLQRGLALIYLDAFIVALNQFRPLLGENGLLPVPRLLARTTFKQTPTIFHRGYSDRLLVIVSWSGIVLAACTVLGLPARAPEPVDVLVWLTMWMLYLSIVNVGQTFYGFGWESLLLEAGFLAAFLGPSRWSPPVVILWLVRWLLFRLEFGAGLIKMRGDRCWRDLTCLYYHHETQPMPNPLSRWFHLLPKPLHRVEVLGNHFAQLVAPFGLFLPQPVAGIAAAVMIVTQLYLVISGNFSWLNWTTIMLALSVLPDSWLHAIVRWTPPHHAAGSIWFMVVVLLVGAFVLYLSYWPAKNMLSRAQAMNASFNPLHLVNTYGAFGSVTRERDEVIVEGTLDDVIGPDTEWRTYEFKGKPGDVRRRPPQIAPYHLRLDWLMWFIPLSPAYAQGWFMPFLAKLLENDRATLALLRNDPFPEQPPRFVRAQLYRYRFATRAERRRDGNYWIRSYLEEFVAPVALRSGSDGRAGGG
jgi:hypothetical protein